MGAVSGALMRKLYTLLFSLVLPAVLLRLYWRGRKAPDYRLRWRERLGSYPRPMAANGIWFHAVSVGEVEAALPLIKRMLSTQTEPKVLVTCTTPTGSARIRALLGNQVEHVYLPYDVPWIIERFMRQFRPRLAVFLEKEVWPNLFATCAEHSIPLFVVNARLSARSASAYQKIPSLIQPALRCITLIAAQTEDDYANFLAIGASAGQLRVLGNIKFDLAIDPATVEKGRQLKQQSFAGRWVWIVASSHHDEEAQLLPVYRQLKQSIPELLLVIVPRHPERFQTVAQLCVEQGLTLVKRSSGDTVSAAVDVYLADSMGELKMLYAAADMAFVGGSLVSVGGHNVLEAAAVGVPVIFGPQMFNFQDVAERMLRAQAAVQCADVDAIAEIVLALRQSASLHEQLVVNAQAFVLQNQGATERVAQLLEQQLSV